MPGVREVFAGMFECGSTTHVMLGDPDAVAELVEAMEATMGGQRYPWLATLQAFDTRLMSEENPAFAPRIPGR